jgi:hypothetical protein
MPKKVFSTNPVMQAQCEQVQTAGEKSGMESGFLANLIQQLLTNGPAMMAFIQEILAIFKQPTPPAPPAPAS